MELVLLWIGFAVVAGIVAGAKGRSGFGYFILALVLPFIGLLLALFLPSVKPTVVVAAPTATPISTADKKKCPVCAELIQREAKKCRFCGEVQVEAAASDGSSPVRYCQGCRRVRDNTEKCEHCGDARARVVERPVLTNRGS